jgi:hypothetical protein
MIRSPRRAIDHSDDQATRQHTDRNAVADTPLPIRRCRRALPVGPMPPTGVPHGVTLTASGGLVITVIRISYRRGDVAIRLCPDIHDSVDGLTPRIQ